MAVAYSKERVQFDRPIGSFQAVQHLCADMLTALELGRAGAYYALWAADQDDANELHRAATMAMAFASDAFHRIGADAEAQTGVGRPAHLAGAEHPGPLHQLYLVGDPQPRPLRRGGGAEAGRDGDDDREGDEASGPESSHGCSPGCRGRGRPSAHAPASLPADRPGAPSRPTAPGFGLAAPSGVPRAHAAHHAPARTKPRARAG